MEAEFVFEVVGVGLDLVDGGGGDGAEVAHAVDGVGVEGDEDFAGEGELAGPVELAVVEVVEGVVPPAVEEGLDVGVDGAQARAFAEDVVGGEFDDAEGEGVDAVGFGGVVDLLEELGVGDVACGGLGEGAPAAVFFGEGGFLDPRVDDVGEQGGGEALAPGLRPGRHQNLPSSA